MSVAIRVPLEQIGKPAVVDDSSMTVVMRIRDFVRANEQWIERTIGTHPKLHGFILAASIILLFLALWRLKIIYRRLT